MELRGGMHDRKAAAAKPKALEAKRRAAAKPKGKIAADEKLKGRAAAAQNSVRPKRESKKVEIAKAASSKKRTKAKKATSVAEEYERWHGTCERTGLWHAFDQRFGPKKNVLYAGSFCHLSPSFVFGSVTYVDSDVRAERFFARKEEVAALVSERGGPKGATFNFVRGDFEAPLSGVPDASFDLLISQYSGFVGRACKRYLRVGGHLLCNDSHGDASLCALDPDYELVAAVRRSGETYVLSEGDLSAEMTPKRGAARATAAELESSRRGQAFTNPAHSYVFCRVR